ncbi:hypothetical protein JHK86_031326 [Glycine max]|nr:hypothetical protein JHK86_031326 [Glycine max]
MAQDLHIGEHLHRVIGSDDCSPNWRVQFYVSPYACTRLTLHKLRRCFLRKKIICVKEESRVREWNFRRNFVEERMKFVRRQANSVAHCLSRVSRFYVSLHYFDFTS